MKSESLLALHAQEILRLHVRLHIYIYIYSSLPDLTYIYFARVVADDSLCVDSSICTDLRFVGLDRHLCRGNLQCG